MVVGQPVAAAKQLVPQRPRLVGGDQAPLAQRREQPVGDFGERARHGGVIDVDAVHSGLPPLLELIGDFLGVAAEIMPRVRVLSQPAEVAV